MVALILGGCGPSQDTDTRSTEPAHGLLRRSELAGSGFTFQTTSVWETGYCAEMRVTNSTGAQLNGWDVRFELASGMSITSLWHGQWTAQGQQQRVQSLSWNNSVPAGGEIFFGFCGGHPGTVTSPFLCRLNGSPCGSEGPPPPPADTQPPSQVVGLSMVSSTGSSVTLSWQSATDNVGVSGYEVFRAGIDSPVATTASTSVTVGGLAPETAYTFTVKARDAAGNRSSPSVPLTVTTRAAEPNSFTFRTISVWQEGYCAEMRVTNGTGTTINGWTVTFGLTPGMTITSLWLGNWSLQGQQYMVADQGWNRTLPAGAAALFGFCGAHTGTVVPPFLCTLNGMPCGGGGPPPPPDSQPPSQVTGLRTVSLSGVSVDLAWQSATDNEGVSDYEVFLNGLSTPVATTSTTNVSVTRLSPHTTYTFTVKARDAAGNRSNPSAPLTVTTTESSGDRKIVGYFPRWGVYERTFYAKSLHTSGMASKLTHINYAFGNVMNGQCGIFPVPYGDAWADYQMGYSTTNSVDGIADSWEQPLRGNFNQLKKLKARYPHLKVIISLGGWTWSGGFSDAVATPARRQAFVQSCIDLYIRGNVPGLPAGAAAGIFDGIDVDWEFPAADAQQPGRPEDTENFTAMVAEFRRQLDAEHPGLLLTIATGSRADVYSKIQLHLVHPYLDLINVMTYDMAGGWDAATNFHAPLYNQSANPLRANRRSTDEAIQGHLAWGVPASKLGMGVPFYGRGWQGTQPGPLGDGLYQLTTGAARGNWDTDQTGNSGMFDYHYIQSTLVPSPAYVKYRHPEAQVPYVYNPSTGLWVSYDDSTSLQTKADYVNAHGLGGVAIWELSGDDAQGALVTALQSRLRP